MMMTNLDAHRTLRLLRRKEAAQYVRDRWGLPLSQQTLAKLAVIGGGPPYRLAGRFPLYELADLDSYALAKIGPKQRSTSDRGDAAATIASDRHSRSMSQPNRQALDAELSAGGETLLPGARQTERDR
jgi:hypothetical protein